MDLTRALYRRLPAPVKQRVDRAYESIQRQRVPTSERERFVSALFEEGEYDRYVSEFDQKNLAGARSDGFAAFSETVGDEGLFGDIRPSVGRDLYALVRSRRPGTLVETGVCNGFSTLCLLSAMDENDYGHLYSIDYPYRANDSLSTFRSETFDGYGGAAIPEGKEPGWLVPDELRGRWSLVLGKSQRKLPELVAELTQIDLFLHDSEHSLPCMYFEFELAWEWLSPAGILVADDVTWNDAFRTFVETRGGRHGLIAHDAGYAFR